MSTAAATALTGFPDRQANGYRVSRRLMSPRFSGSSPSSSLLVALEGGLEGARATGAAAATTLFAFLGGWTIGRNVIDTLAGDIVTVPISLESGVAILFFVGVGILAGNLLSVPIPTSMTTVGAISGPGWGRATRPITMADAARGSVKGEMDADVVLGAHGRCRGRGPGDR